MIAIEDVIARVTALRQSFQQTALAAPDKDRPEFRYGEACGRDAGFALVLEAINEMLEADEAEEE